MAKAKLHALAFLLTSVWLYGCNSEDAPLVVRMTVNDVLGTYGGYITYEKVDSTGKITYQEQQIDTILVTKLSETSVKMDSRQMGTIVSNLNLDLASESKLPYKVALQSFKGYIDPTGNGLYISSDTLFTPAFHPGSITTSYLNINEGITLQKKYARYKIAALVK
jgi:hypothetical protein